MESIRLLLYLARFTAAPLSLLWISILYTLLSVSTASISRVTERPCRFLISCCPFYMQHFQVCSLQNNLKQKFCTCFVFEYLCMQSSSSNLSPLRRRKSSSCFRAKSISLVSFFAILSLFILLSIFLLFHMGNQITE